MANTSCGNPQLLSIYWKYFSMALERSLSLVALFLNAPFRGQKAGFKVRFRAFNRIKSMNKLVFSWSDPRLNRKTESPVTHEPSAINHQPIMLLTQNSKPLSYLSFMLFMFFMVKPLLRFPMSHQPSAMSYITQNLKPKT